MGLSIQQLFDYIEGLTDKKPSLIVKGVKDKENATYRIHCANHKYYIDKSKKNDDDKLGFDERSIFDKDDLQMFKVKVMNVLSEIKIENIFIE